MDEKAYDMRNRIYACYILCTSILCLVPVIPYYVSKELYKRGYKRSATVSMEVFQYSHDALTFGLIFTKVIVLLLRRRPWILDSFFIKNRDLAILALASMCTLPVVLFISIMRYVMAVDTARTKGCGMVDALMEHSYLADVVQGLPALVCYAGESGPLFTRESTAYKKRYGADVIFDIYLYGTSYLCVLPACFSLLCRFFLNKKKRTALSVSRVLGVAAHVLLTSTMAVSLVIFVLLRCVDAVTVTGLRADSAGVALLGGVLVSSLLLLVSVAFCYYEIGNNVYDGSAEVSDEIAFSVLQFGLLTAAVNCVCSLFRTRAQLKDCGLEYPKYWFVRDFVRRLVSAVLLVPAFFLQLSSVYKDHGKRRVAALAKRVHLYSEIFLGNLIVFSICFYGIAKVASLCGMPVVMVSYSLLPGLALSLALMAGAVVKDLCEVNRSTVILRKKWQEVVLEDDDLERRLSNASVINLLVSSIVEAVYTRSADDRGSEVKFRRDNMEAISGVPDYGSTDEVSVTQCGNAQCLRQASG